MDCTYITDGLCRVCYRHSIEQLCTVTASTIEHMQDLRQGFKILNPNKSLELSKWQVGGSSLREGVA